MMMSVFIIRMTFKDIETNRTSMLIGESHNTVRVNDGNCVNKLSQSVIKLFCIEYLIEFN